MSLISSGMFQIKQAHKEKTQTSTQGSVIFPCEASLNFINVKDPKSQVRSKQGNV